jgi:DNA-binding NarL/FixJ family response regulator
MTTIPRYRILIVDDHHIVRFGLMQLMKATPDLEVVGEAEDAGTALSRTRQLKPDLAIVDLSLKESDGIELIEQIRSEMPSVKVLVLSMHEESVLAERALKAGAMGYIMKQEMNENLLHAVYKVLKGQIYVSSEMADRMLHRLVTSRGTGEASLVDQLSNREFEVFKLLGQGYKIGQVAERLFISVSTAEYHRANIRRKLGIADAAELTRIAIRWVQQTFR